MRILCVDPGQTTGYVVFDVEEESLPVIVKSGEIAGTAGVAVIDAMHVLSAAMTSKEPDFVIYEKWVPLHKKGSDPNDTCQIIGALRIDALGRGITARGQVPQRRLDVPMTQKLMKPHGLWLAGGDGHMRQALRHGLAYLVDQGHKPTQALLYGE